jgi:hypothetical protein
MRVTRFVLRIGYGIPEGGQEMRIGFIAVVLMLTSLQGCATVYSAKETYAQVVDAETHEPLEGANVVAHWVLDYASAPLAMHWSHSDWIVMETVTDSNGQFRFPGWGPKAVPSDLPPLASLAGQDPEVIFFRGGYEPLRLRNGASGPPEWPGALMRSWRWNGKVVELKKFKGDLKAYSFYIGDVLTGVNYTGCEWKKIPRIIVALNSEDARLRQLGVYKNMFSLVHPTISDLKSFAAKNNCGSVEEFLKDYRK